MLRILIYCFKHLTFNKFLLMSLKSWIITYKYSSFDLNWKLKVLENLNLKLLLRTTIFVQQSFCLSSRSIYRCDIFLIRLILLLSLKNGICLVHTIRRGMYMHTLQPRHPTFDLSDGVDSTVIQIKLSAQGRIVVLSNIENQDVVSVFVLYIYIFSNFFFTILYFPSFKISLNLSLNLENPTIHF